jgi:maltooligosyltrehalose synthase
VPLETESSVGGRLVAFARILNDQAVVFAVQPLVGPLKNEVEGQPLRGEAWKTSRIMLPRSLASRTFRHALTNAEIQPMSSATDTWIFAGQVFDALPIAMLTALP